MKYYLDSNICIFYLRGKNEECKTIKNIEEVELLCRPFEIIPFDVKATIGRRNKALHRFIKTRQKNGPPINAVITPTGNSPII